MTLALRFAGLLYLSCIAVLKSYRRADALSRVFLRCSGRSSFFASSSAEALLLGLLLFGGIYRLFALRFFNGLAAQGANALYNDNRGRAGVDDDVRACEVFRAALV